MRFTLFLFALAFAPVASAQTKWHPGHYMRVSLERVDRAGVSDDILNSIANEPAVQGVSLPFNWAVLEGPTPGSYDFSRIDHLLAVLSKNQKRLIVDIWDHTFAKGPVEKFDPKVLPAYLNAPEYGGGWASMRKGGCAPVWRQAVMDRFIALYAALGKRYDSNPWFEMICAGETARGMDPAPADFSQAAYAAQWARWAEAVRKAWPNTNAWLGTNFPPRGGKPEDLEKIIAACYKYRIAIGGPDILPNDEKSILGVTITNGVIGHLGDLRGKIALRTDHQVLLSPTHTPARLYDNAIVQDNARGLKLNYISWVRRKGANLPDDWDDDVLPFIRAHPHTIEARPSSYPAVSPDKP